MLGCQDFCGYYDWSFHYIRRRWGNAMLSEVMGDAIGGECQAHYLEAAKRDGLRGLLRCWDKTGVDEHCDWTFRLDEAQNVLRWDMRQCPSKGFLLGNDLNADEDYCDHCMGWIVPLLAKAGMEVVAHEHNHCGQCWAEMRVKGKPYQTLADRPGNVQDDPRWSRGFVERWTDDRKQPLAKELPRGGEKIDPSELIVEWFAGVERPTILTGDAYAANDNASEEPTGVILEDRPDAAQLDAIASRFLATPADRRPLLMCAYFPSSGVAPAAFVEQGLPRPVQLLPLLIRTGLYVHRPGGPYPDTHRLNQLLHEALRASSAVS